MAIHPLLVRTAWHRLETINAVTYFSPECRQAPLDRGLRGFWMGYFAGRAAPMGAVPAGVVEATFFNFHPDRVRRAIPDAWGIVTPAEVTGFRAEAAASALRRLLPDGEAERVAANVLALTTPAVEAANGAGKPLFSANREVTLPDDPVAALWQTATTLREHRGDLHVALLTAAGMDGCEAHVMFAACEGVDAELYLAGRGWSRSDWEEATERLRSAGLLTAEGSATAAGRDAREEIERRTDELAAQPYEGLGEAAVDNLIEATRRAAHRITSSGEISYPNPMGLPPDSPG